MTNAATFNDNTGKGEAWVRSLPLVGVIQNNWRQRRVELYADPEDSAMLYMYGMSTDGSVIITHEQIGLDEHRAMDYWAHGKKVLVRD